MLIPRAFILIFCVGIAAANAQFRIGKNVMADSCVVVSARTEASRIGARVMKNGGNAFDAMIAVQLALAVCYPEAGNLGGGGFMVARLKDGTSVTLDFREKAPAAATETMYQDANGNVLTDKCSEGNLSSGVPGSVDAIFEVYQKYASKPFSELIQPAIQLARRGYRISKMDAEKLNRLADKFKKYNQTEVPFIKYGTSQWFDGDTIRQPELAATLELIRDSGRAAFYEGKIAQQIVATMQHGGGLISRDDLKTYKSAWRDPLVRNYRSYKIITMPPPSSGGVALLQLLGMTEPYDFYSCGWNCEYNVQTIVEAERRVYADRAQYLGDPDFVDVPVDRLLGKNYLAKRLSEFRRYRASRSDEVEPGTFDIRESDETTHYSIVDQFGNAVAVTTTLNNSYGSYVMVEGAGFLLNNEMDDFSAKPGAPNAYGLIGGSANAISPGKRMLSSMTPTILEQDGKLFMVLGTPGGATIITTVFQVIMNVVQYRMTLKEAVDAPRFHHQWLPDEVRYEKGALDEEAHYTLKLKGYKLTESPKIGRMEAIKVTNGKYEGAADWRGDDGACGW